MLGKTDDEEKYYENKLFEELRKSSLITSAEKSSTLFSRFLQDNPQVKEIKIKNAYALYVYISDKARLEDKQRPGVKGPSRPEPVIQRKEQQSGQQAAPAQATHVNPNPTIQRPNPSQGPRPGPRPAPRPHGGRRGRGGN